MLNSLICFNIKVSYFLKCFNIKVFYFLIFLKIEESSLHLSNLGHNQNSEMKQSNFISNVERETMVNAVPLNAFRVIIIFKLKVNFNSDKDHNS